MGVVYAVTQLLKIKRIDQFVQLKATVGNIWSCNVNHLSIVLTSSIVT